MDQPLQPRFLGLSPTPAQRHKSNRQLCKSHRIQIELNVTRGFGVFLGARQAVRDLAASLIRVNKTLDPTELRLTTV